MNSAPVEMPWFEHLVHRAVDADLGEAEDAEHNEAQVADRGVGDQLLHVRLHHGDQCAGDDADERQDDDPGRVAPRLVGEEAEIEAQQTVGSHLQQHAGQQDGTCRRRFHVRVRQPGVKREERNLDGERYEESEEQPLGRRRRSLRSGRF